MNHRIRACSALALAIALAPAAAPAQGPEWFALAAEADARQPLRTVAVVAESEAACNATLDALRASGLIAIEDCAPADPIAIVDPNSDPDASSGRKQPSRPRK
ncbi:hypothetical protein [Lysobacter silvisoli]|uniref:Uncharacterized protein n=1 Tax=Lysobacter silvisoli TaxID=2293254 RepID=A0A371JZG3_9GAMM|nr:hypothetical protein [Lysobacter silvisoli]RDZ26977.1 hypothetical protein DX914_11945 [Lysobacter silvisoli]